MTDPSHPILKRKRRIRRKGLTAKEEEQRKKNAANVARYNERKRLGRCILRVEVDQSKMAAWIQLNRGFDLPPADEELERLFGQLINDMIETPTKRPSQIA